MPLPHHPPQTRRMDHAQVALDVVLRMHILVGMNNAIEISSQDTGHVGNVSSLYDACKAIVGKDGQYVVIDSRPVAYWCGWRREVRAMSTALPAERAQIQADAGLLVQA